MYVANTVLSSSSYSLQYFKCSVRLNPMNVALDLQTWGKFSRLFEVGVLLEKMIVK